jgi:C-terminal processing protease CtpA/Prc
MKHSILFLLTSVVWFAGCYPAADDQYIDDTQTVSESEAMEAIREKKLFQNEWTYAQMKENYFWTDDLPAASTVDFEQSPMQFFKSILSPKDRFSWIEANTSYREEGALSMYDRFGLEYQAWRRPDGSLLCQALLIRKHSPAFHAGLKRGDWFRTDGGTAANGTALTLQVGRMENGDFVPRQTVSLVETRSDAVYTSAVSLDTVYTIGDEHRIGYLFYNGFEDAEGTLMNPYRMELREIFARFAAGDITDLIVDLRYNPGGYVSICEYLAGLILPDESLGQVSFYHEYNGQLSQRQYEQTGNREEVRYFPSKSILFGRNIGMRRLYAILTGRSFSASESLVTSLAPYMPVVKIGSTSGGKGVGSWAIADNRYPYQLQPIIFRYYNRDHVTVPDTGLTPDVPADETHAETKFELGDTRELLLSVALNEITGMSLRSTPDYGKINLTPVDDPLDSGRRRTEGYVREKDSKIQ